MRVGDPLAAGGGAPGGEAPGDRLTVRIRDVGVDALATWHAVPIRFDIEALVDLARLEHGVAGPTISTRPGGPTTKDYDGNELPATWARFDTTGWRFLHAERGDRVVGAAVLAVDSPDIRTLAENPEVAILWDIRVAPSARGTGVGSALFAAAVERARGDGRRQLLVETQDNNVGACRFYASRGCRVHLVSHGVYDDFPDEAQIIWLLDL